MEGAEGEVYMVKFTGYLDKYKIDITKKEKEKMYQILDMFFPSVLKTFSSQFLLNQPP